MKNSKYWVKRERDQLYNAELQIAENQLAKEYKRCYQETKRQLIALYDEIKSGVIGTDRGNGEILISDLYKYNRYYDLINNLNHNLSSLGIKENQILEGKLKELYLNNLELIKPEIGFVPEVNEEMVKNTINAIWCGDGEAYFQRTNKNKLALEERVRQGMVDTISKGATTDQLVKDLQNNFELGFYQADRIARTELSHIQNQSTLDGYNQAGVEYFEYFADSANDDRVCDACADLDGKIFKMKDAQTGINVPPIHPNCRCSILAVIK